MKNFMQINNHIKKGSENKYFPLIVRISSSLPTRTPPQYENILFSTKPSCTSNNFYAILAWCWRLGLGVWVNLLGLKLLGCLNSLFFWVLRNYCSILLKVEMFILVWVSWSHSCCFYSFSWTNKYLWRNLKTVCISESKRGKIFDL